MVSGIEVQENEVAMVIFDSHDDVGSSIDTIESTQNHTKASQKPVCCFLNYRRNKKLLTSIGQRCCSMV